MVWWIGFPHWVRLQFLILLREVIIKLKYIYINAWYLFGFICNSWMSYQIESIVLRNPWGLRKKWLPFNSHGWLHNYVERKDILLWKRRKYISPQNLSCDARWVDVEYLWDKAKQEEDTLVDSSLGRVCGGWFYVPNSYCWYLMY